MIVAIESLLVEDLHKGFSPNGFRKKFNDMVVFLNLSSHLTPQACRSFYILEMLKKTKGDISLVSKRIGISSKIIVENYIPYLNVKSNNEIIDLFSSENIETKTKVLGNAFKHSRGIFNSCSTYAPTT